MTSNIGADKLQKEAELGFSISDVSDKKNLIALHEKNTNEVLTQLKKIMRPELLNRIDKVTVFHTLSKLDISSIIEIQIDDLRKRMQKQKLGLQVDKKTKKWLLDRGYDAKNGVRPMRRLIQDEIEDKVAEGILNGNISKGSVVTITTNNDAITYSTINE